ncbi:MAG: DUF5979 domain-containing protein, partial [Nakamurella sp.]
VVAGGPATVAVSNSVSRLWAGLDVTKDVVDPDGGVIAGAQFPGSWSCELGDVLYGGRFSVGADATMSAFTPADELVPATATCSIVEDTLDNTGLVDGSFDWDQPSYDPESVTLVAGETASLGVTNTVVRVYSDVQVTKTVTGPAVGLVDDDRFFDGTVSCQYGTDAPVLIPWQNTLTTPDLISGILVESVCTLVEESPPGAGGQPVTGDSSYIWLEPELGAPVVVTPPGELTPPLVVTNPTDRLFGSFTVGKAVTGAVDGIVNPPPSFLFSYVCQPGSGDPISAELTVTVAVRGTVGQDRQIPIGSVCTVTEPVDGLPELRDSAWSWDNPAFTIDGVPATPVDGDPRSVEFTIPEAQEDEPEPVVDVDVANNVTKTAGVYTVSKSSDPASGETVQPGDTIDYTLTVTSPAGSVPVHDVVVTDDLAEVLPFATIVDGSIAPPDGTSADVDAAAQQLVWTVGTLPANTTGEDRILELTYQVIVNPGAAGITVRNQITSTADVPPTQCSAADVTPDLVAAAEQASPCSTEHPTTAAPTIVKQLVGSPEWDPATGVWTVRYDIVATNPNPADAIPYTLTDTLGFPAGTEIRSATATLPEGVTPAEPPWDGTANTLIAQDVELPAGATHTFQVVIQALVPLTTPVESLTCAEIDPLAGNGLFNQAALQSLGSVVEASACSPVPAVVTVDKEWQIDGVWYPDGSQPDGFSAALTLNGEQRSWRTDYPDFAPGVAVDIGEDATVPADCTNEAVGLGALQPVTALTAATVVNVVSCSGTPIPPVDPVNPIDPVYPVNPISPTYPITPLPNTGFAVEPFFGWGFGLIMVGVLLLLGAGLRVGGRRQRQS